MIVAIYLGGQCSIIVALFINTVVYMFTGQPIIHYASTALSHKAVLS